MDKEIKNMNYLELYDFLSKNKILTSKEIKELEYNRNAIVKYWRDKEYMIDILYPYISNLFYIGIYTTVIIKEE